MKPRRLPFPTTIADPDLVLDGILPDLKAFLVAFSNWRWSYREGTAADCARFRAEFSAELDRITGGAP